MREAGWPSAKEVAAEGVIFRESTEKSRTFACVMMKPEPNHFLRLVCLLFHFIVQLGTTVFTTH